MVSLNYKKSVSEFRGRLAFENDKKLTLLTLLREAGINEAVYVSTCNRCEIYGVGKMSKCIKIWAQLAEVDVDELKEQLLFFDGEKAVEHLFHVTAGFDSMVLGEDEILRQIKDSYKYSFDNGFTDYELNMIFQAAIGCSKKIKTKTKLSKTSVSVASLAATKIHNFKRGEKKVMIMGVTGDTGNKVLLNLLSYGDCKIYATKHIHHISNPSVVAIPYAGRYDYIKDMDVIVSATRGPHYTLTYGKLKNLNLDDRARLFVDLAVPKDMDEDIENISGSQLISIDDFNSIAKENNKLKYTEKENGEAIIEEAINTLLKDLTFHIYRETYESINKAYEGTFEQFVYKFKSIANAKEFESFINVIGRMQGNNEEI